MGFIPKIKLDLVILIINMYTKSNFSPCNASVCKENEGNHWCTNRLIYRQTDSCISICPPFLKRYKIIKPLFVQMLITFCDIKCMKTRLLTFLFFFFFFLEIFKMKGAVHEQLHQNPHPLKSQLCAHVSMNSVKIILRH